ncbi:hypothetical protein Zm00014a_014553 [Zea mays]|uniref:Uncharacterized protein n=2 Tax=Zea mays TaxID=4577 RepID=A0A3L6ESH6_MAIZE|nr:hypothetical protein Zm00014a_011280 [Zea mays]PWZ23805.1 hypothetical protein Zm00014a_014553 [Zea mays]
MLWENRKFNLKFRYVIDSRS